MKILSQHPSAIRSREHRAKCPDKNRAYVRKRRANDPEKFRAAARRHYYKDLEKSRAYFRKRYKENPDRARTAVYLFTIKKRYGLDPDQYHDLIRYQSGGCACCGQVLMLGGRKNLSATVDHDHGSGKVRGILCNGCNKGLGNFGDSPARCEMAAAYLRRHKPEFKSPAPAS